MEMQHFSHHHPLAFFDEKDGVCSGCKRSISGPAYCCTECRYSIHKSCVEQPPQVIQHPFHQPHLLTLMAKAPYHRRNFECYACKETCYGFTYHCSECQFDLDTVCASLGPSAQDDQQIQHLSHRHPLMKVECHDEDCHTILCNWCERSINGMVYICFDCKFFVHKSCAELAQDIQLEHFSHQHPLAVYYNGGVCSACENSISGPAYGCTQCQYFIHKSCGELPEVINYPFHPTHPLTLLARAPRRWRNFVCAVCNLKRHSGFIYSCSECKFEIDICCSKIRPSTHEENDRQRIQHFSHRRHPLIAITLPGSGSFSFPCSACRGIVKDLAYLCAQCKFIIHKSCAELPKELQHPFHPPHSLTLLAKAPNPSRAFRCYACNRRGPGFNYHCFQCKYDLDIFCATLMPLSQKEKENDEQQIQHVSHSHAMFPVEIKLDKDYRFSCSLCEDWKGHSMCVCFECKYFIHTSCAEFPGEIRHPFHPEHLLTLLAKAPDSWKTLSCYACNRTITSSLFHCSQCDFSLDFICGLFVPLPTTHHIQYKEEIQHCSHPHPLIPVTMLEDNYRFDCSVCNQWIKGSIYVCIKCQFFIHKSCTDFPQEIHHHPFHPEHSLILLPPPVQRLNCSACTTMCHGFAFQCSSSCPFQMHPGCAMAMRTIEQECYEIQIQHFSHRHPLILIKAGLVPWNCSICREGFGGKCYACIQCMFFLCKSCVELPEVIDNHPIHPQHRLNILAVGPDERWQCKVCEQGLWIRFFLYRCSICNFTICPECQSRPTVKYERHEHFLVYMHYGYSTFRCNACDANCTKCFLRCAECNLNLHVRCIPALPLTVKHDKHKHTLTLTDPLTQDVSDPLSHDDSDQFYCNACEGKRNPNHSIYYCAGCEFVAHVDCGISEVVLSPDEESYVACHLMDAGISISDDEVVRNDSVKEIEEEESDQESDAREAVDREEKAHFNISEFFHERLSKDLNEEAMEEEVTVSDISKPPDEQRVSENPKEKTMEEEEADQETDFNQSTEQEEETDAITEEVEETNQERDTDTDSTELEEEIDVVREEIKAQTRKLKALTRKLKALQRTLGKNLQVASKPEMQRE